MRFEFIVAPEVKMPSARGRCNNRIETIAAQFTDDVIVGGGGRVGCEVVPDAR